MREVKKKIAVPEWMRDGLANLATSD